MVVLTLLACGASSPPVVEAEVEAPVVTQEVVTAETWRHFGAPFSVGEALPAAAVLTDPAAHAGKVVRFEGELTEVCQKMGCWAVVRDDAGHAVRITMKEHAFGIDKDTVGRSCDVEGELVKIAVDPERVKHFESEGSTNPPEAGKTETYEVVATAVAVAAS